MGNSSCARFTAVCIQSGQIAGWQQRVRRRRSLLSSDTSSSPCLRCLCSQSHQRQYEHGDRRKCTHVSRIWSSEESLGITCASVGGLILQDAEYYEGAEPCGETSKGSCYNAKGDHSVECNVAEADCGGSYYASGFVSSRSGCCHCKASCPMVSDACTYYDAPKPAPEPEPEPSPAPAGDGHDGHDHDDDDHSDATTTKVP